MHSWDYQDDIPLVPVRIMGKALSISRFALIDTGAKYCVVHESLSRALGLEAIGEDSFRGFGGKGRFQSELVSAQIELAGTMHRTTFASIGEPHFPLTVPKIVLGRNLLNLFRITLDGPSKKIIMD
jgi:predicted aspartyl protease